MTTVFDNNKRIAKNTLYLYIRMLFTMGVTLFTSRVVLNTLGVEDFGIYNIVGGIVVMFAFLNSSMSGATSRFLTFEIGMGNHEKLKKTFSTALTIHFIIAVVVLILGETIGLWWLENKLIIAPNRMVAARWVYHLSILSTMINVTQIPYNAMIIAYEKMNVYAYIEIFNKVLQLGIVYLLIIGYFDKLILYAILTLSVSVIITIIYRIYCLKKFSEFSYIPIWDKEIIYSMLSFSGWNAYGTLAFTMKTQGVNILLNLFFGVVVNAAYGIASQVQNAVQSFSSNFIIASQPQIIKYYASNEIEEMQRLLINVSKFSFLLLLMISLPLIIENHFVLQLWLKNVPDYAVPFCQINLISGLLTGMFTIITTAIYATGKIKYWSIISSTIYLLVIPISFFLLKKGATPEIPFFINIILLFIGYISNLYILHLNVPRFSVFEYFVKVVCVCFIISIIVILLPLYIHISMDEGWPRLFAVGISSVLMTILLTYFIAFDPASRKTIIVFVLNKLKYFYGN